MKRVVMQILFAVMTALLLLCGWIAAPLLGRMLGTPSLSAQKETETAGISVAVQTLQKNPIYSFTERGKIVSANNIRPDMISSFAEESTLDLANLFPLINYLYRGTSTSDEAIYREDGIEFSEGYIILSLYQCAPITIDQSVGGVVAYGPGGLACTGDDTLLESGTKEEQQEGLRSMLLALQALRLDGTAENHAAFSDLLAAVQLSDSATADAIFVLLCEGTVQLYHDGQWYYLGFSYPFLDMSLYLRLNVGAQRITGLNLLCRISQFGGKYDMVDAEEALQPGL